MADDKNNSDEPSIEEILSSIREIISDDDEEGGDESAPVEEKQAAELEPAAEETQPEPEPEVAEPKPEPEVIKEDSQSEEDEVLDLAEFAMDDEEEVKDPLEGIDLNHSEDDDLDLVDAEEDDIDAIMAMDKEPAAVEEPALENEDVSNNADSLINDVAESATVVAMAKLAENISLSRTSDGVTLENIVSELLRPMLKDWLDENLPEIIERLVSQELERLAQKAVRK